MEYIIYSTEKKSETKFLDRGRMKSGTKNLVDNFVVFDTEKYIAQLPNVINLTERFWLRKELIEKSECFKFYPIALLDSFLNKSCKPIKLDSQKKEAKETIEIDSTTSFDVKFEIKGTSIKAIDGGIFKNETKRVIKSIPQPEFCS